MTPAQLATARRCQAEFGLEFPLVEASAEDVPLPSESFDLAVSEYGASIWCDPHLWIPEAHRLLRPDGRLWFCATARSRSSARRTTREADRPTPPPATGSAPRVARRAGCRVAAPARRAVPPAAANGVRRRRSRASSTLPMTPSITFTTRRSRSSGRASGPPRRSGSRRSPAEVHDRAQRRHRSVLVHRPLDRGGAARSRPPGADADAASRSSPPVGPSRRDGTTDLRRLTRREPARRGHPLQHVLGSLQARRDHLRRRRGEHRQSCSTPPRARAFAAPFM